MVIREELRGTEDDADNQQIKDFICEYANQNRVVYEEAFQNFSTTLLGGILGAMSQYSGGSSLVTQQPVAQEEISSSQVEQVAESSLFRSDSPLDESAKSSLAAMFGDDEEE